VVFGQAHFESAGEWAVPNLTAHPSYEIPGPVLAEWIRRHQLDVVVFNEEYDWELVRAAKETGVRIATYLDFYTDQWRELMGLFDVVVCSTMRTYKLVRGVCQAAYVGWAVDLDLYQPRANAENKATFFHNAGWLGNQYRKMTPGVILAFDSLSRHLPDLTLLIHSQIGLEKLPVECVRMVRENPRIEYRVETLPAPGLYHRGKILLFPSKLEGLGLPLLEGLASGLPAIATDAEPMNEFVRDKHNGLLVRVAERLRRQDDVAFPETIVDLLDLALKMAGLALEPELIEQMGRNARQYAETSLDPKKFGQRLFAALSGAEPIRGDATGKEASDA
jgi:glycosyltransferase involved in cell wall biosynthesis